MKFFNKYFLFLFSATVLYGNQIKFDQIYGTEVWSYRQTITGTVTSSSFNSATIYINQQASQLTVNANLAFSADVILSNGMNEIYIQIDSSGTMFSSDTLRLKLGYKILPDVEANATGDGYSITLKAVVLDNPKILLLKFVWIEDLKNPAPVLSSNEGDAVNVNFAANMPAGEYYFDLLTITSEGDTAWSRTMVTLGTNGATAFDIKKDHANWIDQAVIYQVTPYCFVENGKIVNVTKKIPELAELGINTIYLQPIYQTQRGGQGYDVMDYFKIRSDYGNENNLKELISTARKNGMHVILDFVPNHCSIEHYFAKQALQYGTKSHYYNFFQREKDTSPYSGNLTLGSNGFVYYFDWSYMPNLNFDNIEVQNYILSAVKFWVQNFDVDGFRFDAVWAISARSPEFTKKLRLTLKRIKPEILLLAEDKAAQAQVFDERFDAAYDWAAEYSWVSHWVWQTNYSPYQTVFMSTQNQSQTLRNSLNNNGNGYAANAKILRFLENNDTERFIVKHGLDRTKMAAALLFSLNGLPMMYNGQEVGNETHPYSAWMIFFDNSRLKDLDEKYKLFDYYKNLISLRKKYKALTSDNFEEISLTPNSSIFGFRRWTGNDNIISVINFAASSANVSLTLPIEKMNLDSNKIYYLTNLFDGSVISGNPGYLKNVDITMDKYSADIFLFADSVATVVGIDEERRENTLPVAFKISQNYPNPFNASTVINYSLPSSGNVSIKVTDIIGREVAVLVDELKSPGNYAVNFDAGRFSSGVYIYRIDFNGMMKSNKMILLK